MAASKAVSSNLPWRTRVFCSLAGTFLDSCVRKDGTVNRRLSGFLDWTSSASSRPVKGASTVDFTVDSSAGLWFRLFIPTEVPEGKKLPVIVFFHGGGFALMAANSKAYDTIGRRLARRLQAFVVSVNYRLAPEHRFPTAYDDGEATLRWISTPGRLPESADLGRCFLVGDSAGGNIVHHVGHRVAAASSAGEDFRPLKIAGHVLIQPFFGGEERLPSELRLRKAPMVTVKRADFMWRAFLPEGANRDHPAANVTGPNAPPLADIGLPPTLVVVGGLDTLQDWQRRYYEALREAGVQARMLDYPEAIHGFHIFPKSQECREFMSELKSFMEEHGRGL
ncbi:probable carboxylesterase 18 [Nymphaea colorata]|uniref:probable carboxylesterase 18 n=1 Tax=Nymphaea colorata TaxID=210225 RepID=UPI00129E0494|nr:probable carboxylesterase 18 [Nymphaea colorata]XP_049934869.1 probable carboxylesterase 18 [Nymphaea colorata]XP_049934870.1 probable carboxylesterase 18 [Nymphaea colorata]